MQRIVVDQTGLKGKYDVSLRWDPDHNLMGTDAGPENVKSAAPNAPSRESSIPSIFTALQEQLGLKLEPTKGPVDMIIIDHIERPSEN